MTTTYPQAIVYKSYHQTNTEHTHTNRAIPLCTQWAQKVATALNSYKPEGKGEENDRPHVGREAHLNGRLQHLNSTERHLPIKKSFVQTLMHAIIRRDRETQVTQQHTTPPECLRHAPTLDLKHQGAGDAAV